jgi:outer membrane protein assembly factor BamB
VFYPDRNVLRAFDVESGAERWSRAVTDRAERDDGPDLGLTTPPAYLWRGGGDGLSELVAVGVAGDRNELRAYTVDGELAWRTETPAGGRIVGAPAYGPLGNRLCVGTTAERLLCVDATTGDLGWSRRVFGAVGGVAVGRESVEAATAAGEVYGISADDGSGRWRRAIDRGTECALALTGGLAFLADSAGTVYATSGNKEVWQNKLGSAAHSYQGVAVDEKRVYVVTEETGSDEIENLVSAVYARTGEEAWSHRLGTFSGSVPAVVDDTLYVSSGDGVVAVATGETGRFESRQRWHWRPDGQGDGPFDGPVVPADGRLFVPVSVSDGGELVALE